MTLRYVDFVEFESLGSSDNSINFFIMTDLSLFIRHSKVESFPTSDLEQDFHLQPATCLELNILLKGCIE